MKISELTTYQTTVLQAKAHRAIKTKTSYFLREYNITMMQWAIIGALYASDDSGMRVSDLATQLDTSLAFITTTLNVLEAKGVVERSSHSQDNRAKIVRLTKEFKPKVEEIEKGLAAKLSDWLVPVVGSDNLDVYVTVLDKIAGTVDNQ